LKNLLILIFFSCCFSQLIAQKEITISGTVKDTLNKSIPYIDVLLKKKDSTGQILAFAITDDAGRYKIVHQLTLNEVVLETSSLAHDTSSKLLIITQNTQKFTVDITLKERTEALQEVEIKAAARVQIKNDTTTFNLEILTNGTERIVEDILKKLPGITLEKNGRFKFKGKDVNNVLLDGDNLFDGGYTVGTKNINAKHITSVDAIENFEDNPMLQGLTQNEQVALNLKFKESLSLSGNATLGYGYKDRYFASGTVIAITKKMKGFSVISYNNVGKNRSNEQFDALGYISQNNGARIQAFTAPGYISTNGDLSQASNSIKNNEFFGSLNILPKLSKTETLRLNLDVLSDRAIEQNSSTTIINVDPNNPIIIEQSNRKSIKPFYFNSKVMYRKFINKKSSLFTQFKFSKLRNENEQLGIRNNIVQGENNLFKEYFLSNNTKYTHRLNKQSALSVEGSAAFSEKPEILTLISGIDFNTNSVVPNTKNNQTVYSKKQSLQLQGNYYKIDNSNNKFNVTLSADYFENQLQSNLTNIDDESVYTNNVDYSVFLPKASADYYLKLNKFKIRPKASATLYSYTYNDISMLDGQDNNELLFDASLWLFYEFNKKHTISSIVRHTNKPPKEQNLYTNFILKTNRLLENNELNFNKLTANDFTITYRFTDLFRDINANVGFNYQKDNNAYLSANTITQDVSFITNFLRDNGSENRKWNASFDTYVSALRTTFRLTGSYANNKYFNLVNSLDLRENKSESINTTLSIGTSYIGKFLFGNNLTYYKTNFIIQGSQGIKNQSVVNNFDVTFIQNDRFRIDADLNYTVPNINSSRNRTVILDTSASYENKDKTIAYRLEGKNLLNQQNINQINNTDFSTTSNTQSLFERYFLLSVRFRF
jgi:hypothetical protein